MLTIYFSGTGNTAYIAKTFSLKMEAACLSIEDDADFFKEMEKHDTIAFCYPVYGSRVPYIMRKFVEKHMDVLAGKKLIIFVTQMAFSGDGARAFVDMFDGGAEVIYAEHFIMPNNVNNLAFLKQTGENKTKDCFKAAEVRLTQICDDIRNGIVKKRGFSAFSKFLGIIQGGPWQGTKSGKFSVERKGMKKVWIDKDCTACNICVKICPMKNLENTNGKITHKNNCTICYRCVNRCPHKAITVFFNKKPKWQYLLKEEPQ